MSNGHSTGSNDSGEASFALCVLALLVGLAYANNLQNGFVYDDEVMIERNVLITKMSYVPKLITSDYWAGRLAPSETSSWNSGLYRPLVLLTYALNYAAGGLNPVGYHLVNILLHLLTTWFVYLFARGMLVQQAALVAAAIFALHPLHVEAVTGIVGRAELLMGCGVLAALYFASIQRRGWSLAAFALALMSKEQAMVFPALLGLYDICISRAFPLRRGGSVRFAFRQYGGCVLVLGGYLVLRRLVLGQLNTVPIYFLDNPLAKLEWVPRMFNAMKVAGYYLWLFVWPQSLSADYSYNAIPTATSPMEPEVLLAVLAWGTLIAVACWSFIRGEGRLCFFIGLVILTFLPVSNLVLLIGTIMGERLFYLPSAGLCLLAGWVWQRSMQRPEYMRESTRLFRIAGYGVLLALCGSLMLRTVFRNQDWISTEALMRSAVQTVPQSAKAHAALGGIAAGRANWDQALQDFQIAMRLYPEYVERDVTINLNLGAALLKTGRTTEAIQAFERAVELDPRSSLTQFNLATAYAQNGLYTVAERIMRTALVLNPKFAEAHGMLSGILLELGRSEEALQEAEVSLQLNSGLQSGKLYKAIALEQLGRIEQAVEAMADSGRSGAVPGLMGRRGR